MTLAHGRLTALKGSRISSLDCSRRITYFRSSYDGSGGSKCVSQQYLHGVTQDPSWCRITAARYLCLDVVQSQRSRTLLFFVRYRTKVDRFS